MKKTKNIKSKFKSKFSAILIIFLLVIPILLFSLVEISATWTRNSPQIDQYVYGSSSESLEFNDQTCQEGTDFVLQLAPFGCEPAVIRTDLLEEQNVPIFCKVAATKINPLIEVEAIESISFSRNYPSEVSGVGFHPAKSALGIEGDQGSLNSPVLENIGYAVIVLKQQRNSSDLKNCQSQGSLGGDICYVQGNLSARIRYDIKNAYGIGRREFYLPQITNNDFKENFNQYSFWQGRGFLKADYVDVDGAKISIYGDENLNNRISSVTLKEGETSNNIHLPGFYCLAGLKVKLNDLVNPDTRAILKVNSDDVMVGDGEKFVNNLCRITNIEKSGLIQKVEVRCNTEDREDRSFSLEVMPKVSLDVNDRGKDDYGIGEKIIENWYLGFIGTLEKTGDSKDLYVRLVNIENSNEEKLSEEQIRDISKLDKSANKDSEISEIEGGYVDGIKLENDNFKLIKYDEEESVSVSETNIKLNGFGETQNSWNTESFAESTGDSNDVGEMKDNYEKAISDYKSIINNYGNAIQGDSESGEKYGVVSYQEMIKLASYLEQNKDALKFCEDFKSKYPQSYDKYIGSNSEKCQGSYLSSNAGVNSKVIVINGGAKKISLQGIEEPSFKEYGAVIQIRKTGEKTITEKNLEKGEIAYIGEGNDFIKLENIIDEEGVRLKVELSSAEEDEDKRVVTGIKTLKLNEPESFDSDYSFMLKKINLQKQASVSLIPNIENTYSEAEFPFKVGIEKRAIQLTPEKTLDKIEGLNDTINEWKEKSETLGKVVEGLKGACIAMQGILTMKNFLGNLGGQGIARKEIMRGEGGIRDLCQKALKEKDAFPEQDKIYSSMDECYSEQSDLIDKAVKERTKKQKDVESIIKDIQDNEDITSKDFLGKRRVDDDKLVVEMLGDSDIQRKIKKLESIGDKNKKIEIDGEEVEVSKILDSLKEENKDYISPTELRDLMIASENLESENFVQGNMAEETSKSILGDFWINVENHEKLLKEQEKAEKEDLEGIGINVHKSELTREVNYNGYEKTGGFSKGDGEDKIPVTKYVVNKKTYYLELERTSNNRNQFVVDKVFTKDNGGYSEVDNDIGWSNNLVFNRYDDKSYNNPFKASYGESEVRVRYFETAPYAEMPAMVPFDTENGWYVASKQTLGIGTSIKSYDESGRANSFWLCNVGSNGREEFPKTGHGDDICQQMNSFTPSTSLSFAGLDERETKKLVECAQEAIQEAAQQHGNDRVSISTRCGRVSMEAGDPAVNTPEIECVDVMSPKDCKLLFNVCDPVLCPSSRCDLGGRYPVRDVIQSGIVGSLFLCLPNFVGFGGENFVPVCLTGVKAGIDGLLSIFENYRDCLQTSLETGSQVAICDEIHSIYLCDFLWQQGLPIMDMVIPSVLGAMAGENVKGGGEYLGVANAWDTAKKSIDYFTQYYGANSYKAFKARTTQDVAKDAVCGVFMSGVYPSGGDLLDSLTAADSPSQFHGRFDEIPFTDRTVPPTSQYKVFYHIYAGDDQKASYSVYLKGTEDSSYYKDTGAGYTRTVASGYIAPGDYASETEDFTAPAGYKEMCIRVNSQEECGFKEVSTSFAIDYLNDKHMEEQASSTDIKTEEECVSGSRSAYSLVNSPQGAMDELADPAIYNSGITRVCATENPGKGTDSFANTKDSRWKEVGYCGDKNVKCWLDSQSVEEVIKDKKSENETLEKTSESMMERLADDEKYIQSDELDSEMESELEDVKDNEKKISILDLLLDKVLMNKDKAKILLERAGIYGKIAKDLENEVLGGLENNVNGGNGNNNNNGGGSNENGEDGSAVRGDGEESGEEGEYTIETDGNKRYILQGERKTKFYKKKGKDVIYFERSFLEAPSVFGRDIKVFNINEEGKFILNIGKGSAAETDIENLAPDDYDYLLNSKIDGKNIITKN